MTAVDAADRILPAWSNYVWLARGEASRLYPTVRELERLIESAGNQVTSAEAEAFRHKRRSRLDFLRLKSFCYGLAAHAGKEAKYRDRVQGERRAIDNAALVIGADRLSRGDLSQIMNRHGSDKGVGHHNYTLFYEILLSPLRNRPLRILEIGIGTNDPDAVSTMGAHGKPGASLRGWRDYFPKAVIFGADIDRKILFEEERIKTRHVDQTNPHSVDALFAEFGSDFDIIIDDGLHVFEANRTFLECAFDKLRSGGLFVIEDVRTIEKDKFQHYLKDHDAALLEIPNQLNTHDNCLAVVVRA